mgnify:FL=1
MNQTIYHVSFLLTKNKYHEIQKLDLLPIGILPFGVK